MGIPPTGTPRPLSQEQLITMVIADLVIMGVASTAGAELALRSLDRAKDLNERSRSHVIDWFRAGW